MLVGVAVHATREWHRTGEITRSVTLLASDVGMFSDQRIFCLGVIERPTYPSAGDLRPSRGRVARLTRNFEQAVVRIAVAIRALSKGHAHELHCLRVLLIRLVALLAGNATVVAGQRKTRSRMIKMVDRFPIVESVALRAILPQSAAVCI